MLWRSIVPAVLVIGLSSLVGSSRELHWRRIDVEASLDREGRLHVTERQVMVFTGDWNGGERTFNLRFRQALDFHRLLRADAEGGERPLIRGDLAEVDRWDWAESRKLRWRSRLPSDPPFDRTEITYVLEYTLSDILIRQGGSYLLDHDFCFPDRTGPVETFTLRVTLDPAWVPARPLAPYWTAGPLPPGRGFVVTVALRYEGAGAPAAVWVGAPAGQRGALLAIVAATVLVLLSRLYRRERSLGRFSPVLPASSIDEAWLRAHLFSLKPEVVGAAWDERTGAAEVAAVIARLVAEGKLHSEVRRHKSLCSKRDVLHLRLLVPRDRFEGYEGRLIDALFIDGETTDTERVREHYRKSGFDPVGKIRGGLSKEKDGVSEQGSRAPTPRKLPTLTLALAGAALLALAGIESVGDLVVAGGALTAAVPLYILALVAGLAWRNRVVSLGSSSLSFLAPLFLLLAAFAALAGAGFFSLGFRTLAGLAFLTVAAAASILNVAKSRQGVEKIAFRKRLAAAREFFRLELNNPRPRLLDSWFPYIIAFGLGGHVDRWFRAYGGAGVASTPGTAIPSGSAPTLPSGWTGGGGTFGGAGASATWAAAAGTLAAGVAAPSSGGGSGGGGGGSGGGGGGGW
jgi:hypothetical protein